MIFRGNIDENKFSYKWEHKNQSRKEKYSS